MQTLYPERFTLKEYIDNVRNEKHIEIFKKSLDLYQRTNHFVSDLVVERLNYLINPQKVNLTNNIVNYDAKEFFKYIYDETCSIDIIFEKVRKKNLGKEYNKYKEYFKKYSEYFSKICTKEDNKRYWKKRSISQEYNNEDIIITDGCYILNEKSEEYPCDLSADTIYGDWSCTCYNKDTKEKIGKFCADSGNVSVSKLKDVLKYDPNFEKWIKEHNWCVTVIPNFTGVASIIYDIENYEYKGKQNKDLVCYVEGKGNINFTSRQTGF